MSEKAVQNFSHGWSDDAYANVVNGEVQVEAEALTGGSPSIHGTTPSKLVAGDDTTMSRFGHYSIFSGCLSIGYNNLFASISLANCNPAYRFEENIFHAFPSQLLKACLFNLDFL